MWHRSPVTVIATPWVRGLHPCCTHHADPQKLWGKACVLAYATRFCRSLLYRTRETEASPGRGLVCRSSGGLVVWTKINPEQGWRYPVALVYSRLNVGGDDRTIAVWGFQDSTTVTQHIALCTMALGSHRPTPLCSDPHWRLCGGVCLSLALFQVLSDSPTYTSKSSLQLYGKTWLIRRQVKVNIFYNTQDLSSNSRL